MKKGVCSDDNSDGNMTMNNRTDCEYQCEALLNNDSQWCMSGMYSCTSSGPPGCSCSNMGPVAWSNAYLIAPGDGQQLCSFSCHQANMQNSYHACLANCYSGMGGGNFGINKGSGYAAPKGPGFLFRRGGRTMMGSRDPGSDCMGACKYDGMASISCRQFNSCDCPGFYNGRMLQVDTCQQRIYGGGPGFPDPESPSGPKGDFRRGGRMKRRRRR